MGVEYVDGQARTEGFKDNLSKRDLVEAIRQLEDGLAEERMISGRLWLELIKTGKTISAVDSMIRQARDVAKAMEGE